MSERHAELTEAGYFDAEPGEGDMPTAAELAQQARELAPADGPYHFAGRYYKNPDDADRARQLAAERAADYAARVARYEARQADASRAA